MTIYEQHTNACLPSDLSDRWWSFLQMLWKWKQSVPLQSQTCVCVYVYIYIHGNAWVCRYVWSMMIFSADDLEMKTVCAIAKSNMWVRIHRTMCMCVCMYGWWWPFPWNVEWISLSHCEVKYVPMCVWPFSLYIKWKYCVRWWSQIYVCICMHIYIYIYIYIYTNIQPSWEV